ncbi:MAG: cyclodeaminase/cyclohydrolase family protein [Chloroflexota bacterium]|jgi:Methenyl tetrahydrofolate cyclohydrolase|nr:MAG: formiminotransferase-cyclodeaminase [Chloroflexota bacterium]
MSEQLLDKTLGTFLNELASGAPTPGGGSVAALTGAMAAGLITMVCDLTIGKKAYAEFEAEAMSIRARAEELRAELQQLAQDDITTFSHLSAAYKLPRTTEADAASRKAAIQRVLREATEVPLRTARAVVSLLPLCAPVARHGNRSAVSDVAAAAILIRAAVPAALLNVETNLMMLEDQLFVHQTRAQVEDLTIGLDEEVEGVLALARARIQG